MKWVRRAAAVVMLVSVVVIALTVRSIFSAPAIFPEAPVPEPFYIGGIQVNEPDHAAWVDSLRDVGMNTVGVTVYAQQGDWNSAHLWWHEEQPAVLDEIRRARQAGLRVTMILRLAVDHAFPSNEFVWHGMVMPRTPEEIEAWFDEYTRFAVHWAAICEREGVELLGIGSELNSMTQTLPIGRLGYNATHQGARLYEWRFRNRARRFADQLEPRRLWEREAPGHESLDAYLDARYAKKSDWADQMYLTDGAGSLRRVNERRRRILDHWRELIRQVRAVFGGRLTYAANFDSYQTVAFWPELDVVGINGYFPLREHLNRGLAADEKLARFESGWRQVLDRVRRFKESQGIVDKPVVFTELGYTYRRHSTVEPWNHSGFSVIGWKGNRRRLVVWGEQPIDYQERHLAVEALRRVHRTTGVGLAGILYWKFSTRKEHEAIEPFVLHVGPRSSDPLQTTLVDFLPADRWVAEKIP